MIYLGSIRWKEFQHCSYSRVRGTLYAIYFYSLKNYLIVLLFNYSKSESRMFPNKIPVTVPNVLGFIFANLNRTTRLHAIVLACKYSKVSVLFNHVFRN